MGGNNVRHGDRICQLERERTSLQRKTAELEDALLRKRRETIRAAHYFDSLNSQLNRFLQDESCFSWFSYQTDERMKEELERYRIRTETAFQNAVLAIQEEIAETEYQRGRIQREIAVRVQEDRHGKSEGKQSRMGCRRTGIW